jgi:serine/threonine protein phosphatase PrpC
MWVSESTSVRGASHVRKGMVNQDRVLSNGGDGVDAPLILAVADGHGSAAYIRSDVGAEIAVQVASEVLRETWGRDECLAPRDASADDRWIAEDRIARRIVAEWTSRVQLHIDEHPSTDATFSLSTKAYGSTLLAAVLYKGRIAALQLGDGDILCCDTDGCTRRLIDSDHSLMANETHSLCMKNAAQHFRFGYAHLAQHSTRLLLLSSDGYSNSFADDAGFLSVLSDIHRMLPSIALDALPSLLEAWAAESTNVGSGDDISIVLAFDRSHFFPRHDTAPQNPKHDENDPPFLIDPPAIVEKRKVLHRRMLFIIELLRIIARQILRSESKETASQHKDSRSSS